MDFYIVLGLRRDASLEDVKRAYKRLARRYHPGINPGDRMAAAQFRDILAAYETLSDPMRRESYDAGAGCIEVTYTNNGSTSHTLLVEGKSGFKLSVGDEDTGTVELPAGSYELYCDVAGHRATMNADLSVS